VPAQYELNIKAEILNVFRKSKHNASPHIAAMQSHFPVRENIMYNQEDPSFPSCSSTLYSNQTPIRPRLSTPHQQHLWALTLTIPISTCYQNHKNTVNVILSTFCDNFVTSIHRYFIRHVNVCCSFVSSILGIQYRSFASYVLFWLLLLFNPRSSIEMTWN
jgi:hypothetical protein